MTQHIDDTLVEAWFAAWSRSRGYTTRQDGSERAALRRRRASRPGTSAPTTTAPAAEGVWEHILVNPSAERLRQAAERLRQSPEELVTVFGQTEQDPAEAGLHAATEAERLMSVELDPELIDVEPPILPEGYEARLDEPMEGVRRLRLVAVDASTAPEGEEELAGLGWVTFQEGTAVFDRIWTAPNHRRRGLGTMIMRHLTAEAMSAQDGLEQGLLVASPDGQKLYGHLGWTDLGPVTVWTLSDEDDATTQAEHSGTMRR
ncbi:GNAT family N-acetyltransferase [Micrococcus sp.]|uniref:GNAT family N-acetyltransferase n=1 Tax=Micrococcus sp. TaxID=1271 RepID=UPI002A91ADB0|nr:GNAT family N-acetyltransferase [Micrococcus sp.]MDY6055302.1 GNAT family N-acetyltransferase [Micrococcus sp.]